MGRALIRSALVAFACFDANMVGLLHSVEERCLPTWWSAGLAAGGCWCSFVQVTVLCVERMRQRGFGG